MSARVRTKAAAILMAAMIVGPAALHAQGTGGDKPAGPRVELLAPRFVAAATVATAGSLALLPFDGRVRSWMQAPARQNSGALRNFTNAATPFGSAIPIAGSIGLYAVGRLAHDSVLADVGLHLTEAIGAAGTATMVLKVLVGRARPYVGTHDPHAFGRGRLNHFDSGYQSFPSGHATVAFAMAAGGTEEVAAHWPGKQWIVGPILYATAASVAFARMYDDKHWASDVTAGAVVGTLVGSRVVRSVHTGGGWILSKLNPVLLFLPGRPATLGVHYAVR